jgi:hypothetical protein
MEYDVLYFLIGTVVAVIFAIALMPASDHRRRSVGE